MAIPTTQATMYAIQADRPGGPEVLALHEIPRPQPGPHEVLVHISAIGVNFMDIYGRRDAAQPFIPGGEAAGTVDWIGEQVLDVHVGEQVVFCGVPNCYAEYVAVPADRVVRIPDSLSPEDGCSVMLQGMTAHYLIHEFHPVHAGTIVLVHAAAGGVGRMASQIATHLWAHVIGTVSTPEKEAAAREAGAIDVINYMDRNFVDEVNRITFGKGVDLILDGVGKSTFAGDMEAVKTRGTIVIYGHSSGMPDPIVPNSLMKKSVKLGGGMLMNFIATQEELETRANDVFNGVMEGWIKPRIDHVFPLAEAMKAHRLLESRQTIGKVLLKP